MFDPLRKLIGPKPLRDPRRMPSLAAWFDALDVSSMVIDGSNRVSLWADKSGNSGVNCLVLNGVAGNYASAPDSAALDITGDIDLRVKASLVDWTPSVPVTLVGKYVGPGENRSYRLTVGTSGNAILQWTPLGTAASLITATSTAVIPVSNFEAKWIRGTLDVSNGSTLWEANFYTSDDGVTWTPLGTAVLGGAATSIFSGSGIIEIGSSQTGTNDLVTGIIYRAQIYNGINGTLVFDANFAIAAKLATSFTESSVNAATVTINTSGATGARISGERDLYQGTVANQPVYLPWSGSNYGYLNGVSANYFSTPDSASFPTGDIDISYFGSLDDWTPATAQALVSKDAAGGSNRTCALSILIGGLPYFYISVDGTATSSATASTLPPGTVDGADYGIRVTRVAATGVVTFYHSPDGVTWTQLGTTKSTTSGNLFDSTAELWIGKRVFNSEPVSGRPKRVQISGTIGGAAVFDFDASRYTSGPTFVASTGETWTVNGGAQIVTRTGLYFDGSNDYFKSAAFALVQPETVYFVGSQVTWTNTDVIYDGNTVNAMQLVQTTVTPDIRLYAGGAASMLNSGYAVNTRAVVASVFNSTSSQLRINRVTAVANGAAIGTNGGNGFTLATGGNNANPSNIFVSEVAIYSTIHGDMENNKFVGYAAKRHRLTL